MHSLVPASMDQSAIDIPHHQLPQNWQIYFYFLLNLAYSHYQFLHIKGLRTFITNYCFILCQVLIRIYLRLPLRYHCSFDRHYSPSTVNTYVLAIGYKLASLPDPSKPFLLLRCSRVMEWSVLAWRAGYLLPCQFFEGSYWQPLNLMILFIIHVDFRLCAYLLFTHSQGWGKSPTQSHATSFKPSLKIIKW